MRWTPDQIIVPASIGCLIRWRRWPRRFPAAIRTSATAIAAGAMAIADGDGANSGTWRGAYAKPTTIKAKPIPETAENTPL